MKETTTEKFIHEINVLQSTSNSAQMLIDHFTQNQDRFAPNTTNKIICTYLKDMPVEPVASLTHTHSPYLLAVLAPILPRGTAPSVRNHSPLKAFISQLLSPGQC